jgi:uncharacterized membrane protein YebE (DUF533 family)
VNNSEILSIFLRGALGSRGRKRARRAANFLGGHRGFLSASTLLGAAGVAWGLYDSMKNSGASGASSASSASSASGGAGAADPTITPPPIPGAPAIASTVAAEPVFPNDVLRVVRLAVSAARADGTLLPAERALILSHAREAGVESVVEAELAHARPMAEIVGGVTDEQRKRDLYILAFTIVRADEHVSGAERIYLAQLAHQLGLDGATVATLEGETASRIDATPDHAAPSPPPLP